LLQATILARGAAVPPIIRLLPGTYPTPIELTTPTSLPLRYVASGATVVGNSAVHVQDGAKAEIRGLTAVGSSATVQCTSTTTATTILTLTDCVLRTGNGGANLVYVEKCALTMNGSELDIGSSTGASVTVRGDSSFTADRIHAHGANVSRIGAGLADRISVKITNSLFENIDMAWQTYDTTSPGSLITLAFNTIVLGPHALSCQTNSGSAYRKIVVENNAIVASNVLSAINGTDCMLAHNIITPFPAAAGSNIVADPQFLDAANGDYHLMPTSPAVDAAVPSGFALASPDYDGVARPQGPQPDIGAFEYRP
jgi:hypothetical protein